MRRKTYLFVLFMLGLIIALSGGLAQAQDGHQHFLWEVGSSQAKVYLLGSLHFFTPQMYPLDSAIETAYQGSAGVAVEVDLNKMNQGKIQQFIMEKATYANGDSLKRHLSQATYSAIQKRLNANGMDITSFNRFRPWFIATFLTTMELQKAGVDPSYGIDRYFTDQAAKDKKGIDELETWDLQLNLLNSLGDLLQEEYLASAINDLDNTADSVAKMESAWRTGDTATMERLVYSTQEPAMQPIYEKMFYERNRNMAAKIDGYIKSGKTIFVVVGSGHLIGPKGILSLLRQAGYSTRQL